MNLATNSARRRATGLAAVLAVLMAGCLVLAGVSEAVVDEGEPSVVAEYDPDEQGGTADNPLTAIDVIVGSDGRSTYLASATTTPLDSDSFPITFYYSETDVSSITVKITSGPSSGDMTVTVAIDDDTVGSISGANTATYDVPVASTVVVTITNAGSSNSISFVPASTNTYTVTCIVDGETYATETVAAGSTATAPTAPHLTGCVFTGWYTDEAATDLWNFETVVTGDLVLYAGWVEELEFTSVPTISSVVITQTNSSVVLTATAEDWESIVWTVDGVIMGYGETVTVTLDEGTHAVVCVASNSLGSAEYSTEVTVTASADGSGTAADSTDWILVAAIAAIAVLGLTALYTRNALVVLLTLVALAAAVLRWMGVF